MDTEEKYLERLEILVEEEDFALAEALVGQALSYGWEEESLATGQIKFDAALRGRGAFKCPCGSDTKFLAGSTVFAFKNRAG